MENKSCKSCRHYGHCASEFIATTQLGLEYFNYAHAGICASFLDTSFVSYSGGNNDR